MFHMFEELPYIREGRQAEDIMSILVYIFEEKL